MKFSTVVFAVFAAAAATITSVAAETNAERFARGLPPLPPARRPTPVRFARRGGPSSTPTPTPNPCQPQCCKSTHHANEPDVKILLGLLGVRLDVDLSIGLIGQNCSPMPGGNGGHSCQHSPVCCKSTHGDLCTGCVNI